MNHVFCLFHAQSHEKYTRIEWEPRNSFITGQNSVENPPIIANDRIISPVLHLKLGIFKQFIKYLKNEDAYSVLAEIFPRTSSQKVTAGIFTGPQVDKIADSDRFVSSLTSEQQECLKSIVEVFRYILAPSDVTVNDKRRLVDQMIHHFQRLEINCSTKMHYCIILMFIYQNY